MLRFVRSWSAISRSLPQFAQSRRPQSRRRLTLECLEDRAMLSTIPLVVNTLADSGVGTLRDAITVADKGAITNPTNQYAIHFKSGLSGAINLTSALPDLENNITIKGPGETKLTVERVSTAPDFSVFTVDSGESVSLSGMTISGGNNFDGGGIYNDGTLTVKNITFTDNSAIDVNLLVGGGGIGNYGTATVIGSTFTDNTAEVGGGIFNKGNMTVSNSTFTANTGYDNGGGIASSGKLAVNNSVFSHDISELPGLAESGSGGGISSGSTGILTVSHSVFSNNSAGGNSGGIAGGGTVIDSIFIGNSAPYGGGIYAISGGNISVIDSIFIDNSATYGGGIYHYDAGTLTVIGDIFVNNIGGDIYPQSVV